MHITDNFVVLKGVEILYPRINRPYRFDEKQNRTVPCEASATNAQYETKFIIAETTAKKLHKAAKKEYAAKRKNAWPEKCPPAFKIEQSKDGEDIYVCTTRKKAMYDGEKTELPKVFDSKNKDVTSPDFMLTTGSTANIAFSLIPYSMTTSWGVSLRLHSVQVINLAATTTRSPFDVEDEGYSEDEETGSPFAEVVDASGEEEEEEEPVKARVSPASKAKTATSSKADMSALIDNWDDED